MIPGELSATLTQSGKGRFADDTTGTGSNPKETANSSICAQRLALPRSVATREYLPPTGYQ
jgi:hypothetical protein